MATTTVLLREDLDTVGGRGEVVKVKAGFARNYLLPKGLATLATKGNIKQIENERTALLKKAAIEKAIADAGAHWNGKVVTEVVPFRQFYKAENYHQEYFKLHGTQPYCQLVVAPKVAKFRKLFHDYLK